MRESSFSTWLLASSLSPSAVGCRMLTEEQLREAEIVLRKRMCQRNGHSYDVIINGLKNKPSGVACSNCGEKWWIHNPFNSPTVPIRTIDAPTEIMTKYHGH